MVFAELSEPVPIVASMLFGYYHFVPEHVVSGMLVAGSGSFPTA